MTYIYTEHDYLAHHGIKGMRWGVRRYQNEDGSLTSAGEKRYQKNVKYKEKLLARQDRKISRWQEDADEHQKAIDDLRKHGKDSDTYKKHVAKKMEDAYDRTQSDLEDYDEENGKESSYVANTLVSVGASAATAMWYNNKNVAAKEVSELIGKHSGELEYAKNYISTLQKNKSNLMNMKVGALTKRSDIRKAYRGKEAIDTAQVKADRKAAKEAKTRKAVKDYNDAFNRAERMSNESDAEWRNVKQMHKQLGRTAIGRAVRVARNENNRNDREVQNYLRAYNRAERNSNRASDAWVKVGEKRRKTGKTRLGRVYNNIRYSKG